VYQKGPVQDTSNRRSSFSPHVEFISECFGTVTSHSTTLEFSHPVSFALAFGPCCATVFIAARRIGRQCLLISVTSHDLLTAPELHSVTLSDVPTQPRRKDEHETLRGSVKRLLLVVEQQLVVLYKTTCT
jgi:hypothetical protein